MELKDIAVIAGKPGLYRIVKPARSGVLVEPLGGGRKASKMMINTSYRVSILQEVAIYTTTVEESVPLAEVLYNTHEKYEGTIEVNTKDDEALREFMESVLPEYDLERVYPSDIKKFVNWYKLLTQHAPELLVRPEEKPEEEEKAENTEENNTDEF